MTRLSLSKPTPLTDYRRALELSRYLTAEDLAPVEANSNADGSGNISTLLAPLCQLVALQCRAPKVLLNVMDRNMMYFLSEASTTEGNSESYRDSIIRACSGSVPLQGRICEMTIRVSPTTEVAPLYVVSDLLKSEFRGLSVVAEHPHYRFYAGTPIATKDGIAIGSLAFMDTKPRTALTSDEEACLIRTAATVMLIMETHRAANEGTRSLRLARTLEVFLSKGDNIGQTPGNLTTGPNSGTPQSPLKSSKQTKPSLQEDTPRATRTRSKRSGAAPDDSHISDEATQERPGQEFPRDAQLSRPQILDRAAKLMYGGFACSLDHENVLFLSVKNRALSRAAGMHGEARILASARTAPVSSSGSDPSTGLTDEVVRDLVDRYPTGCIFLLNEFDEAIDGHTGDQHQESTPYEIKALKDAFPSTKQVLFAPVWDADVEAYSYAALVTLCSDRQTPSPTIELSSLNSYCSSVSAELSRVSALRADKQKSDFVRTISHEMRSPLHGILASNDFLMETPLSSYQKTLVNTVHSCSRTLLDTIDHVLDFSKISTFQQKWHEETKRNRGLTTQGKRVTSIAASSTLAPQLLQLTSVIDVGIVAEEVVDSLVLGQHYVSTVDVASLNPQSERNGVDEYHAVRKEDISILIHIQKADWTFFAQPGAIRRIILNLVGNALKYTSRGSITVRLELSSRGPGSDPAMTLTIADTGKGIGEKYLSTLLFVPFAQENDLAPGTGLGLSIVHSIASMLGGTVDVQSMVGKGTTVTVVLPLQRPPLDQVQRRTTAHNNDIDSAQLPTPESPALWLSQQKLDYPVFFQQTDHEQDEPQLLLMQYMKDWFGFSITQMPTDARIVVVNERDVTHWQRMVTSSAALALTTRLIVILCDVATERKATYGKDRGSVAHNIFEWVQKPIGPQKLARALKNGLQRLEHARATVGTSHKPKLNVEDYSRLQSSPAFSQEPLDYNKELSEDMRRISLYGETPEGVPPVMQDSEYISFSHHSDNAQKAATSPAVEREALFGKTDSFPFPELNNMAQKGSGTNRNPQQQPHITAHRAEDVGKFNSVAEQNVQQEKRQPRTLIVEDNTVNLGLLKSFLTRKRKYTQVDCALNGQEAMDLFISAPAAYDIVFMDISMPVMDGFEATRQIREFERTRAGFGGAAAMIIALTGLSSTRDQVQGFEAGMDIYMTKPVSFKDMGLLLDNWEVNKGMARDTQDLQSGRPGVSVV